MPQQFPLTSIFDLIDLSSLGIQSTDEAHRITDKFTMLAANMFNPVTLTEPIEPENLTLPETANEMVEPPSTMTQNGKGKKC